MIEYPVEEKKISFNLLFIILLKPLEFLVWYTRVVKLKQSIPYFYAYIHMFDYVYIDFYHFWNWYELNLLEIMDIPASCRHDGFDTVDGSQGAANQKREITIGCTVFSSLQIHYFKLLFTIDVDFC